MTKSCLLCGVGGQGTVLASRIIAEAAMERGYFARTAETIGMAQRGGCVVSHVRFGDEVRSPMIPVGKADVLIGFEPGEAVRNLSYLREGGTLIVCDRAVFPMVASLGGAVYDGNAMISYLKGAVKNCRMVKASDVESACGTLKTLNIALLGAAAATGALGLTTEDVARAMTSRIRANLIPLNKKALELGAETAVKQYEDDK